MLLRLAVIGAGYWGGNLIRVFNGLGVIKSICDKDKAKLKEQSIKFPNVRAVSSAKSVLKDKEIDAVAISTPSNSHYILAKHALLSQKHVFVEKPLALKVTEAEELIDLAEKQNRILMVGHILHYHPAVIKLKELMDNNILGKIRYIYSNRLNIGKLRHEENVLWSFAPHDISCILMLLNEFPKKVSAFGGKYLQKKIYDTTLTTLDFSSGVKAHIFVSWLHPFKERRLVVIGAKKMAVLDNNYKRSIFLYPHEIKWNNRIPVALKANKENITVAKNEPLKTECQHFIDCVVQRKIPKTDGKEALKVLRVLSMAEESLKKKGNAVLRI